jgi:hypothetical protein
MFGRKISKIIEHNKINVRYDLDPKLEKEVFCYFLYNSKTKFIKIGISIGHGDLYTQSLNDIHHELYLIPCMEVIGICYLTQPMVPIENLEMIIKYNFANIGCLRARNSSKFNLDWFVNYKEISEDELFGLFYRSCLEFASKQ